MSGNNPLGIAISLAESKYGEDKAIQSLLSGFRVHWNIFKSTYSQSYHNPLAFYMEALDGKSGCSLIMDRSTTNTVVTDSVEKLIALAKVQTRAECFICALQDLGEKIEY